MLRDLFYRFLFALTQHLCCCCSRFVAALLLPCLHCLLARCAHLFAIVVCPLKFAFVRQVNMPQGGYEQQQHLHILLQCADLHNKFTCSKPR